MSVTCVGKLWTLTSFLGAVASCVGFYFPYWLRGVYVTSEGEEFPMAFGSFRRCTYPAALPSGDVMVVERCGRYTSFLDIPSIWWQICTVCVGGGSGLSLLLALTAAITLCLSDLVTRGVARLMGGLQLAAAILVGAGVAMFPIGWSNWEVRQVCGATASPYNMGECELYWAFYLVAAGGGLTLLSSPLTCHAYHTKTHRHAPFAV